jgi:hypothetical protein
MVGLAGFPSLIPALVTDEHLDQANVLEGAAYGLASLVGAALGGLAVATVGSSWVIAFDATSYAVMAVALWSVPALSRSAPREQGKQRSDSSVRAVIRLAAADPVLRNTTIMFALFKVGDGALLVVLPTEPSDSGSEPGVWVSRRSHNRWRVPRRRRPVPLPMAPTPGRLHRDGTGPRRRVSVATDHPDAAHLARRSNGGGSLWRANDRMGPVPSHAPRHARSPRPSLRRPSHHHAGDAATRRAAGCGHHRSWGHANRARDFGGDGDASGSLRTASYDELRAQVDAYLGLAHVRRQIAGDACDVLFSDLLITTASRRQKARVSNAQPYRQGPVCVIECSIEAEAFLDSIHRTPPEEVSGCGGWTAHEIAAHVAGIAIDVVRHLEPYVQGDPVPKTRSFEEREAPLHAIDHPNEHEVTVARRLPQECSSWAASR